MCLALPGRILSIQTHPPEQLVSKASAETVEPSVISATHSDSSDPLWLVAEVDFGGVRQAVSLACLPEARVGDRVLVHVGIALSIVDEELA